MSNREVIAVRGRSTDTQGITHLLPIVYIPVPDELSAPLWHAIGSALRESGRFNDMTAEELVGFINGIADRAREIKNEHS